MFQTKHLSSLWPNQLAVSQLCTSIIACIATCMALQRFVNGRQRVNYAFRFSFEFLFCLLWKSLIQPSTSILILIKLHQDSTDMTGLGQIVEVAYAQYECLLNLHLRHSSSWIINVMLLKFIGDCFKRKGIGKSRETMRYSGDFSIFGASRLAGRSTRSWHCVFCFSQPLHAIARVFWICWSKRTGCKPMFWLMGEWPLDFRLFFSSSPHTQHSIPTSHTIISYQAWYTQCHRPEIVLHAYAASFRFIPTLPDLLA